MQKSILYWDVAALNGLFIALFHIKSMYFGTQHAYIFHNESLWLQFQNCT